ncbi:MAG: thiamine pyrophosphate-binding protein, partial [Actinobacteria bacterium]|nr:thiamine pyrophosphate-binding protein [Actinomycetota bacterium]
MSVTGGYLSEIVANGLLGSGSKFVFGLPGGGNNLDVVGAAESVGLEFILAHGETSAAIMASTYAEISGSPCACLVTRGPGAASAVNGLAQAALDRQPLILLTDTVSSIDWARISHQRIDQRELLHTVAKWSAVLGSSNPENTMASALATAIQPRPGPVHLDLDPSASG